MIKKFDFKTPGREDDDVETKLYTKADVNARKEAVQFGKSFIQNENGDMIGPLGSSDRRVIQNQYVQNLGKIAKQCNLSPVTIKKVLASTHAAGSNKITRACRTDGKYGEKCEPDYSESGKWRSREARLYADDQCEGATG